MLTSFDSLCRLCNVINQNKNRAGVIVIILIVMNVARRVKIMIVTSNV